MDKEAFIEVITDAIIDEADQQGLEISAEVMGLIEDEVRDFWAQKIRSVVSQLPKLKRLPVKPAAKQPQPLQPLTTRHQVRGQR